MNPSMLKALKSTYESTGQQKMSEKQAASNGYVSALKKGVDGRVNQASQDAFKNNTAVSPN